MSLSTDAESLKTPLLTGQSNTQSNIASEDPHQDDSNVIQSQSDKTNASNTTNASNAGNINPSNPSKTTWKQRFAKIGPKTWSMRKKSDSFQNNKMTVGINVVLTLASIAASITFEAIRCKHKCFSAVIFLFNISILSALSVFQLITFFVSGFRHKEWSGWRLGAFGLYAGCAAILMYLWNEEEKRKTKGPNPRTPLKTANWGILFGTVLLLIYQLRAPIWSKNTEVEQS